MSLYDPYGSSEDGVIVLKPESILLLTTIHSM